MPPKIWAVRRGKIKIGALQRYLVARYANINTLMLVPAEVTKEEFIAE